MCPIECSRARRVLSARRVLPDLYMPAMPPLGLIARIRRALDRRACRRQLEALLGEDDHRLVDLGLTRAAIHQALRCADDPCRQLARTLKTKAATPSAKVPFDSQRH